MSCKRVVLIVDEQNEISGQVELPLYDTGNYKILKASNEADAFELILEDFVDVILSNLSLTHDNGLALLDKIAELPPDDRPIVYVLGPENILSEAERKRYGIHKIIQTPCKFNLLLEEIGHSVQKFAA